MKCTGIQQQPKSRSVKNEIELHRKNSKCFWTENVFGQHSIEKCKASWFQERDNAGWGEEGREGGGQDGTTRDGALHSMGPWLFLNRIMWTSLGPPITLDMDAIELRCSNGPSILSFIKSKGYWGRDCHKAQLVWYCVWQYASLGAPLYFRHRCHRPSGKIQ